MIAFDFVRAERIEEALDFLALRGRQTKIIAGGTDLMVELRAGSVSPKYVLDIAPLRMLRGIEERDGMVSIGALTTHSRIAASTIILKRAPLLAEGCGAIGARQHRNIGTIGGNIMNASPCADSVPPLVALDAEATFISKRGERTSPLTEIFVGPYRTNIAPDEILTRIRFAGLPAGARSGFVKLGRRCALAVSRMDVAVVLILEDGIISEARISPGSVTPRPGRIREAEKLLLGRAPSEELFRRAGEKVSEEMIRRTGVRWSTPFKKPVVESLVARALGMALGEQP